MSAPKIFGEIIREYIRERICEEDRGHSSPCWVWQLSTNTAGYAHGKPPGFRKLMRICRVSHEAFVGPIPELQEIDHLCRVRTCCNPDHLEAVTHAENMRRRDWTRSICLHGHPLEGDNIKVFADGRRTCRTCNNAWYRARHQRQKECAA